MTGWNSYAREVLYLSRTRFWASVIVLLDCFRRNGMILSSSISLGHPVSYRKSLNCSWIVALHGLTASRLEIQIRLLLNGKVVLQAYAYLSYDGQSYYISFLFFCKFVVPDHTESAPASRTNSMNITWPLRSNFQLLFFALALEGKNPNAPDSWMKHWWKTLLTTPPPMQSTTYRDSKHRHEWSW